MKYFHISKIVQHLLLLVTIPILFVAFALFAYTVIGNYEYNRTTIQSNQETILESIDDHVYSVHLSALDTVQSMEFLFFSNTSVKRIANINSDKLLAKMQRNLLMYNEVVGVVLYNSALDQSYSRYFYNEYSEIDNMIKDFPEPTSEHRMNYRKLIQIKDEYFILDMIQQRYGYLLVIMNPSANENYCFLNPNHDGKLIFSSVQNINKGWRYITYSLESIPLALSYKVGNLRTFTGISIFQIIAILILGILFFSVLLLFRLMQKFLLSPLLELSAAFNQIAEVDNSYRIGKNSKIVEFDTFFKGFDAMLDSLHEAELLNYQHQEEAAKAKMQYLQMQIRPHFYLNCLKTINFLAQIHEDEKIQSIVISLSDYFRYSFQDLNELVTFREEMHSVDSYIDLCRFLYSAIRLELDLPEEAMEVPCLPMTILTFVENCIKHRTDTDEILIKISAEVKEDGNHQSFMNLHIQNSSPFSEDIIESLNSTSNDEFLYRSYKIGISNVRYRMWLLYKEKFTITFSNDNNLATVSMSFPTIPEPDAEMRLL